MKTLITQVTVQVIEGNKKCTVFSTQSHRGYSYDGFNVYDSEVDAIEAARRLCTTNDVHFMSTTKTFEIKRFDLEGNKTTELITA